MALHHLHRLGMHQHLQSLTWDPVLETLDGPRDFSPRMSTEEDE